MDIARLSISLSAAKLAQGAQVGMLKKALEQIKLTGEQLVEMMASTEVVSEGSIDISI